MASVSGAGAGMGTPAANNQPPISGTLDLVRCATRDYRATDMYTLEDLADEARAQAIAAAVLTAAGATGELYNSVRSPGLRLPLPRYKMTLEIASVLITATEDVAVLDFGDGDEGLYIYSRTGPHAGTWTHAQAGGLDIIRRILGILGGAGRQGRGQATIRNGLAAGGLPEPGSAGLQGWRTGLLTRQTVFHFLLGQERRRERHVYIYIRERGIPDT